VVADYEKLAKKSGGPARRGDGPMP